MKNILSLFKIKASRFPKNPRIIYLGMLLLLLINLTPASAHALMVQSKPEDGQSLDQPPGRVVVWFSQEIDSRTSSMRVFDAQDRQVDNGDGGVDLNDLDHKSMIVSLPSGLPVGVYTVHWTVVSADDGDTTEGVFTFAVGTGVEAEQPESPSSSGKGNLVVIGSIIAAVILLAFLFVIILRRSSPEQSK
jgi:copper transport protein